VDEAGLREDPRQLGRGRDREAAHLDQGRLAGLVGQRPKEVIEEGARGPDQVTVRGFLEPRHRLIEAPARDDLVKPANPDLRTIPPAQASPGTVERDPGAAHDPHRDERVRADPDAVPPVGPQLAHELVGTRAAADHVREALRVTVKAAFDRDAEEARMAAEE
jgi:hypothetical protein